jgi:hypothetical protein
MRKPQIFLNLAIAVIFFLPSLRPWPNPRYPTPPGRPTLSGPVKLELRRRPPLPLPLPRRLDRMAP